MATAKSDDENEERSHPLARERPGVYVQVVSPRRRKARPSVPDEAPQPEGRVTAVAEVVSPAGAHYLSSAIDAQPKPSFFPAAQAAPEPEPAPDTERPSGERPIGRTSVISVAPGAERPIGRTSVISVAPGVERPIGRTSVISVAPAPARFASENSNGRADLVVVSLPPPPRMPSFDAPMMLSREEEEFEDEEASALDAAHTLRPAAGKVMGLSWPVLAFIAALSAIVASAGVVAWRGSSGAPEAAELPRSVVPVAAPSTAPRVESLAVPEPPAVGSVEAPAPVMPAPAHAPEMAAPVPVMAAPAAPKVSAAPVPIAHAAVPAAPKPLAAPAALAAEAPVRSQQAASPARLSPAASTAPAPAPDEAAKSPPAAEGPSGLPANPYE